MIKPLCIAILTVVCFTSIPTSTPAAAPIYRPEQVRREINTDEYQLSVQKNNRIDLRNTAGVPIIDNAGPRIYLPDGKSPSLHIDYRQSNRISVNTPLGQGNGFQFTARDGEWTIATYPTQAFLTIDFTYINASRKPISVARLSPLAIDDTGAVHLGPDASSSVILHTPTSDDPIARLVSEAAGSPGHLVAYNPASGTSLIAGFLTHRHGAGVIRLFRSNPANTTTYDRFSAESVFDPPITLPPGERLEADTLYLAIVERNPQAGLERFAQASQRIEPYPTGRHAFHHGWQVHGDTGNDVLQSRVEAQHQQLQRYGWSHVNVETNGITGTPLFPLAVKEQTAALHQHGITLGVTLPPPGKDLDAFISDLKTARDAGVGLVEIPLAVAQTAPDRPREVIEALEAAAIDKPTVVFTRPTAPATATLQDWALLSRSYYLPSAGNPFLMGAARAFSGDTIHFDDHQFITAWSLAALQGGPLRPHTAPTALSPVRLNVLSRLLPAPTTSARPIDLFEEGPPRRWHLPLKTAAGNWNIIGLFNWNTAQSATLNTPLTDLGLNNENYYTVYDFWAGRYLGLIERELRVEVPPEGVRLLGLRRFEKRPMLIASDRHYAQGAADHTALDWSYDTQTLTGTFTAIEETVYTLTILIPEPYTFGSAECTPPASEQELNGNLLTLTIPVDRAGSATWRVTCGVGR